MESRTSTQVATHKEIRRTSKRSADNKEGNKMMCPICLKTKKGGLHTIYCHKCGKAMTYPYEESGELYHSWCLPSNDALVFADEEYDKYLEEHVYNPNIDENKS